LPGPGLEQLLAGSRVVRLLELIAPLGMPHWYVGAGAVSQTVWNRLHGFELDDGIRDYDVAYFDPDLSADREQSVAGQVARVAAPLDVELDVKNQARVHLWYGERFGKPIDPYPSCEAAIATWPTTASCVGIRFDGDGAFVVCAPFGLDDLLAMVVRPNKTLVTVAVFREKAARWKARWPRLTVIDW